MASLVGSPISAANGGTSNAQLNQLTAENASLRARLQATTSHLKTARTIYETQAAKWKKEHAKMRDAMSELKTSGRAAGSTARAKSPPQKGRVTRTMSPRENKTLANLFNSSRPDDVSSDMDFSPPPWYHDQDRGPFRAFNDSFPEMSKPTILLTTDGGTQTETGAATSAIARVAVSVQTTGDDRLADDVRVLNAEMLRLSAENAALKGTVDMLKNDVASDASGQIVRRYEDMMMAQIRNLGRALEAANATIHAKERDLMALKEAHHARPRATSGAAGSPMGVRSPMGHTPSERTTVSTRGGAAAMQQFLVSRAKDKLASIEAAGHASPSGKKRGVAHQGCGTDEPFVERPPTGSALAHAGAVVEDAAASDSVRTLQNALEVTRIQLRLALEELASRKAGTGLGALITSPRRRSNDVGTQVSSNHDIERIFQLFHQDFNPLNVERILAEAENRNAGALIALTEASQYTPDDASKMTLQSTRQELLAVHIQVEELEFALELERREKQRALDYVSGRDGTNTTVGEAARQAEHEIAFLCDTLNATKLENEMLHEKLAISERDRQSAVHALGSVRRRSDDVIKGCEALAETTRMETEGAIIGLLGQLHQRQSELSSVRSLLGQTKRSNDVLADTNRALEKDVQGYKSRLASLRDSTAKLREEYNAVTVALRSARQEQSRQRGINANATGTAPARNVQGLQVTPQPTNRAALAVSSASRPLQDLSTTPIHRIDSPDRVGVEESSELERLAADEGLAISSPNGRGVASPLAQSRTPRANATPRLASSGAGEGTPLMTSYEASVRRGECVVSESDCRLLLNDLISFAPEARGPEQIVDGVLRNIDGLQAKVCELQESLRQRTTQLGTARRDVQLVQQQTRRLAQEKQTLEQAQLKANPKGLVRDRDKIALLNTQKQELMGEVQRLEGDVAALNGALEEAQREIEEGRELMLRLIRE